MKAATFGDSEQNAIPTANQANIVPHIPAPDRDSPQFKNSPMPKKILTTHKPNITESFFH